MPHSIVAIITKDKIDKERAKYYDLVLFSENNFTIIGLSGSHSEYWAKKLKIYDDYSDFFGYPDGVFINITLKMTEDIGIKKFALVATDYFGGLGSQAGRIFENGNEIFLDGYNDQEPLFKGTRINDVLKYIGVKRGKKSDEFDTINLSKYRSFEKYYIKYDNE